MVAVGNTVVRFSPKLNFYQLERYGFGRTFLSILKLTFYKLCCTTEKCSEDCSNWNVNARIVCDDKSAVIKFIAHHQFHPHLPLLCHA